MPTIQVSVGELLDKLSILKIKLKNITDKNKLEIAFKEYELLYEMSVKYLNDVNIVDDYMSLLDVNAKLWDVEDKLRILEAENRFDDEFIGLARQVYYLNDERFKIKNKINLTTKSDIMEVKEYVDYKTQLK